MKSDKNKIKNEINSANEVLETETNKNIYLEQLASIQLIKAKIEQLQLNSRFNRRPTSTASPRRYASLCLKLLYMVHMGCYFI